MAWAPTNEWEYYYGEILKGNVTPPKTFQPNPPTRPPEPDVSGMSDGDKAAAYATHKAKMIAWRAAKEGNRVIEWAGVLADLAVGNKMVTTAAANSTGTGASDPPPPYVPDDHRGDTP
jgi:hypothetical protein